MSKAAGTWVIAIALAASFLMMIAQLTAERDLLREQIERIDRHDRAALAAASADAIVSRLQPSPSAGSKQRR